MKYIFSITILLATLAPAQKFYTDDPLLKEPKARNIDSANNRKLSDFYDLFSLQFKQLSEAQPVKGDPIRARAVNTLGEPMDSAWWQRRHYYKRMTLEELKRGPVNDSAPSTSKKWTVISAKNEGVTPGFTMRDANNRLFFIKFDPVTNLEMATTSDIVVSRIFYALGYNVPENNILHFTPDQLEIGDGVMVTDQKGKKRQMTRADIQFILSKVPKTKDGRFRATASLGLPGKPVGPPRYYGTRTDDPNDIVPHEHRRDLRGLHVINAWIAHDDSRAINNLDILYKDDDVQYIKHFMLDFGSTLGSGTEVANSARSGSYFFTWKDSAKQLFTFGLRPPYWAYAKFPDFPSLGRFEWKVFDPEKWVPEYHNPAFLNRLPDDEFWGAKLVTAFTNDEIHALVSTGELSDPKAAAWLAECLIERRNKIGKVYFGKLLPLDQFYVEADQLKWTDLGSALGYLPAATVSQQWFAFDNQSGKKTPLPGQTSTAVPSLEHYFGVTLTDTKNPKHTVDVFLRGQSVVGIERNW